LLARVRKDAGKYLASHQQRALVLLVRRAQGLGADVERRIRRGRRQLEARAERILAEVERRAARAVERLSLATRSDVERLERRLDARLAEIEAKLAGGGSGRSTQGAFLP